jgi:hypothetical protein
MYIEVVASRKSSVATRDPADMWLFLGVDLHMALQMLLSVESSFTVQLLTSELRPLNDGRKALKSEALLRGLFLGRPPRELVLISVSRGVPNVANTRRQHESYREGCLDR